VPIRYHLPHHFLKESMMRFAIPVVLCLSLTCARAFAAEPPAEVTFTRDITYATVDGEELKLDLSRPKGAAGKRPCVVVIHGGAWRAGHRNQHDDLTWTFAKAGYVSATVSYRFVPKHTFPAQVQDVKAAVRFLRAHADEYNIDVDRFGAVGFSAGAHLSLMLGTMDKSDGLDDVGGHQDQSSKVQCVVQYFGPADFNLPLPDASRPLVVDFLGGTKEQKQDAYNRASPVTYVSSGDAPILTYQGTQDPLVPHDQAVALAEAMTKAGVPGRVELLIGASHGWPNPELGRTIHGTFAFFDQHLKNASGKP
jgi:acetyl esterase/lipase